MYVPAHPASHPLSRLISDQFPWICALWLHLLLYALVTSQPKWTAKLPEAAPPVDVDLVSERLFRQMNARPNVPDTGRPGPSFAAPQKDPTPQQIETARRTDPAAPTDPADQPAVRPSTQAPSRPPKTWVKATHMLAMDVLKDKTNAKTRWALGTLVVEEKWTHICALEAMEQVQLQEDGFRPTQLLPHAIRNAYRKDDQVIAPAGALLSGKTWYEIAFKCTLDRSGSSITGFEYALGGPISNSDWDELGLAPVH